MLRGESFNWSNPKFPNSPHLSKEDAQSLITYVIEHYKNIRKNNPYRIVIHKSSNFWDDELEGFTIGSKDINEKDFVTILESNVKLFTQSTYHPRIYNIYLL